MKKRNFFSTLIMILMITFILPTSVSAASGARHYTDTNGNVFLGGNYIEVGISPTGIFGTTAAPDSSWGFHYIDGKQSYSSYERIQAYLGLLSDGDGWDKGNEPTTGDFFTPGDPEERWILSYKINGTEYNKVVNLRTVTSLTGWSKSLTLTDTSAGDTLSATLVGTTSENVKVTITYTFGVNDMSYKTNVVVENLSDKDITNVRFVRSFDPDQDQWINSTYYTYNKVVSNPVSTKTGGNDNFALVIAKGASTLSSVFFYSTDNRARVSQSVDFEPTSAYIDGLWDTSVVTSKTYAEESDVALSKVVKKYMNGSTEVKEEDYNEAYSVYCDEINKDSEQCKALRIVYYNDANEIDESTYNKLLNGHELVDNVISITTNLGTIAASKKDSTTFITSLNPDAFNELNKIVEPVSTKKSTTTTTVSSNPKTFDSIYLWITLGLVSIVGFVLIQTKLRKE